MLSNVVNIVIGESLASYRYLGDGEYLSYYLPETEKSLSRIKAWVVNFCETCTNQGLYPYVIFTHSPYILNHFMLATYVGSLVKKYPNSVKVTELKKLHGSIDPDMLDLYEADSELVKLKKEYNLITSDNYLNNTLGSFNDDYADLLELSLELDNQKEQ